MTHPKLTRRSLVAGSALGVAGVSQLGVHSRHSFAQNESTTAVVVRGAHPSQPMISDAPAHLAITEATGVQLDFQPSPGSDWPTKRQMLLATDQVPELMYVDNMSEIRDFLSDGVLLRMSDYISDETPNIQKYLEDNPDFKTLEFDGSIFYMPMLYFNWRRLAPMPMIRQDFLEEAGVEAPTTVDELLDAIRAIQSVRPDAVGWTNRNNAIHLLGIVSYPLGSGYGAYFDEEVDGGTWRYGPTTEEFLPVLEFLKNAYEEGILSQDFSVATADDWHTANSSGQGVFTWDNLSFISNWNSAIRGADESTIGWQPLPTLAGPLGARQRDYDFIRGGYSVGANAENPEAIMKMFDWMLSPEGIDTTNWGIEGQHFSRTKDLPESIADYSAAGLSESMPSDRNDIDPAVFEEFGAEADSFRSFQSATGTGLLDFTVAVDDTITFLWSQSDEMDSFYELTAADEGLRKPVPDPSFSAEEALELQNLNREIAEILEPAYDQAILGQIGLSDYQNLAATAREIGTDRIANIYNTAQERIG